ncbi:variant surface glycoprotein (VSG), putative [Trypanosoma brucei brucei TREU927]|uniref:Variant surface glycoprotein (VSG), putative n=1 Tax=Trypanosoma brucei brucei (strain 927/4 GUTat10.1) TaxID=185431 RepID=Q38CP0_TRYB2|nr:variant surface glycoprotein [Trypanosoma brucei brucei TREU927]EAN77430.1 variant surface glycoprotein (VSG), putative [Trypanosoma brucei brucei TREU927]
MAKKVLGFAQLATLIVVLSPSSIYANVGPGDNAAEFTTLCQLISLAEGAAQPPAATTAPSAEYDELMRLNMTLSDEAWHDMFIKSKADKTWHDAIPATAKDPGGWAEAWPTWRKAAEELTQEDKMANIKSLNVNAANPKQKAMIITEIRKMADAAQELMKKRHTLDKSIEKPPQEYAAALKTLAYGDKTKNRKTVTAADAFKGGSTSFSTDCGGAAASNKIKTVAATITCLCHKANTQNEDQVCGRTVKITTNTWTVNGAIGSAGVITEPLGFCSVEQGTDLTSSEITAILRQLKSLIKVTSNDGILGASDNGSCDADKTHGICIKLTNWAADGKVDITKLEWAKQAVELAKELSRREHAAASAAEIDSAIRNLHRQAFRTTLYTAHIQHNPHQTATPLDSTSKNDKGMEDKKKECEKHKNNKTSCTNAKCIWEGKDGKSDTEGECKPKDGGKGTAQTNAGTGDGTAGTGPNCASQTKKEDCEKENVGKTTPVCGWRIGKDNEPDKDKEMCRNGSFLVNKQFALSVVSAAFVALLF